MSDVALRAGDITEEANTGRLDAWWEWFEQRLEFAGDALNPILVKETRQAIKSRQFALTFVMLLIACWGVTIGGVAIVGPGIRYMAAGGDLLLFYYGILAFPLAVIVPFAAFRSLAAERDDNTYDLLAVSTLTPRQIINGKLGSAVVQMGVFFSAVSPCLAFTYLLRGVDVVTILLLLGDLVLGSLGLSMIALLMAAVSNQRYGQIVVSVVLVAGLLLVFWYATQTATEIVRNGPMYTGDPGFWVSVLFGLTVYATTMAILYFAAAGMVTFSSANRSTPLRATVFVQQVCLLGWAAYYWIASNFEVEWLVMTAIGIGLYWQFVGALLTGESPELSRRVRRGLPQTTMGRLLFTWFQPGSGTGYMFAIANLVAWALMLCAASALAESWGTSTHGLTVGLLVFCILGIGYVVAYLGIGRLIVAMLRRWTIVSMLGAFLIQFLLALAGSGIPYVIQMTTAEMRNLPYHYLQVTNPIWTLSYLIDDRDLPPETIPLLIVIPGAALCVFLANLPSLVRETRQSRLAVPQRVVEDEAALHPEPATLPSSPWDEAGITE
ncbi:MAG: hypothetical protein WD851_07955 [Pirellulales bacterium]